MDESRPKHFCCSSCVIKLGDSTLGFGVTNQDKLLEHAVMTAINAVSVNIIAAEAKRAAETQNSDERQPTTEDTKSAPTGSQQKGEGAVIFKRDVNDDTCHDEKLATTCKAVDGKRRRISRTPHEPSVRANSGTAANRAVPATSTPNDTAKSNGTETSDFEIEVSPDQYYCTGATAFVSPEPWLMCCMALLHSRVAVVVCCGRNETYGGFSNLALHTKEQLNHTFHVIIAQQRADD
eukprot:Selendium_serpulae@DN768_c0_g1_i1.p1